MCIENKINKNLFLFCHDWSSLPKQFDSVVKKICSKNVTWNVLKFDDNKIIEILNKDDIFPVDLYINNRIPASRSDIARLILLYKFGGVYSDLSFDYIVHLDEYFELDKDLILIKRDDFAIYEGREEFAHYANGILAATKENKYIRYLLDEIRKNLLSYEYNFDVINATGPGVINKSKKMLDEYKLQELSFKKSRDKKFNLTRVAKFSNSWKDLQEKGILENKIQREIILHVGAHKTGTTSIQRDLFLSRDKLRAQGVIYPHFPDTMANHSVPIFSYFSEHPERFHVNVENGRTSKEKLSNFHSNIREYMVKLASDSNWDRMIISGESISLLSEGRLCSFKEMVVDIFGVNTKINVYYCLRSPFSYHISAIQERIKGSFLDEIMTSYNNKIDLFECTYKKLCKVFGNDNVTLMDFKNLVEGGNVTKNFVNKVGMLGVSFNPIDDISNQSLTYESASLISYFNQHLKNKLSKEESVRTVRHLSSISGIKFILDNDKLDIVRNAINNDDIFFESKFGYLDSSYETSLVKAWSSETLKDVKSTFRILSQKVVSELISCLVIEAKKIELINVQSALELYRFCQVYRPQGPFINSKIQKLGSINGLNNYA